MHTLGAYNTRFMLLGNELFWGLLETFAILHVHAHVYCVNSFHLLILITDLDSIKRKNYQTLKMPYFFILLGYQVVQVVGLVHTDLHDEQTLNAVSFLASSLLWITQDFEQKNSGKKKKLLFWL